MAIYSISDLEKLSGIKAHTLRIWEQRFGLIKPKRTPTNIRYYTDEDLKLLLNIALLNKNGVKISKINNMTVTEIESKVSELTVLNNPDIEGIENQLDALTIAMINLDELKFEQVINYYIEQHSFEAAMLHVINPFLERLTILWLTGAINPAQERFITALIRRKIMSAIDRLPMPLDESRPKFLVYMPEGENQELVLLFVHYLLRRRQCKTIYLGTNIPLDDVKSVGEVYSPDYVFTFISETFIKMPLSKYFEQLCQGFPDSLVVASGYQVAVQSVREGRNLKVVDSLQEMMDWLDEVSAANT